MKTKKIPMRRCVGCMESKPKKDLIRIVNDDEGNLSVDLTGRASGRGVYLCPDINCFKAAKKRRSISNSLGIAAASEKLNAVFEELSGYEKK